MLHHLIDVPPPTLAYTNFVKLVLKIPWQIRARYYPYWQVWQIILALEGLSDVHLTHNKD